MLALREDWDGVFAVAIQMDVLACESSFIRIADCRLIRSLNNRQLAIGNRQ
jgi:hypothetical protein